MPKYVVDPNDSTKQVPGSLPDNAYDRVANPGQFVLTKTPSYIIVNKLLTTPCGFLFGSSASYAPNVTSRSLAQSYVHSSSFYTVMLDDAVAGTQLNIHPIAWSGSAADVGKITFVYKSGLSTGGF
tara:strand:+ start:95 stop:472 length:378 start_codon:yes stop_codon:yes gene_type:complete